MIGHYFKVKILSTVHQYLSTEGMFQLVKNERMDDKSKKPQIGAFSLVIRVYKTTKAQKRNLIEIGILLDIASVNPITINPITN